MPSRPMSRLLTPFIVGIAAIVQIACGSGSAQDPTERDDPESTVVPYVLMNDSVLSGAPEGCTPSHVASELHDLFGQLSSPEAVPGSGVARSLRQRAALADLVERFFGGEAAPFAWFSLHDRGVDGIPRIEARARRDLVTYLGPRPFRHVDLELTRLRFMQWVPERGNVGLGLILFEVYRKQPRERLGYGTGKGEYHCATSSFQVLSLMVHPELPPWAVVR